MKAIFQTIEQMQNESCWYGIILLFMAAVFLLSSFLVFFEMLLFINEKYFANSTPIVKYKKGIRRNSSSKFISKK